MQVKMTSQVVLDSGVKLLVFGQSGMGKTVLTATLPRPLLISAESGLLSLKRENIERVFGVETPGISYDIPVIEVTTIEEVREAYNWCIDPANTGYFDSIALDSLTEIAEKCLTNAKKTVKDPRQAYGELIDQMQTLIRLFRDIPGKHVYFSAKMSQVKDDVTGITSFGPDMPGAKLGPSLAYFFDEVLRLNVNKDQNGQSYRYLQTKPDIQSVCKDRSGALAEVEFPHLGSVINKIKGV